jgi:hypothetical protein
MKSSTLLFTPYTQIIHTITPFNSTLLNITQFNIIQCIITPFNITPFIITPFNITLLNITQFNIIQCIITPFNITPFIITPFNITLIEHLVPSLENRIAEVIQPLKQDIIQLQDNITETDMRTDDLEQYGRRHSLRISGIPNRIKNTLICSYVNF